MASYLTEAFPGGIIARASGTHFTGIVPFSGSKNYFEKVISETERLSIDETLAIKVGVRPLGPMSYSDVNKVDYKYLISMVDQAASTIKYIPGPGSGILYYDEELELNEKIRTHVLANVDRAVRNQWLKVYYQPIVECSTGETAEALGMRTVAEGVETQEQYDFLKSVGCTYAQGYLFSKPLPAEEIYA